MNKTVLSKEEADRVAVAYSPRKFPTVITPAASQFVAFQAEQEEPSFRIDRIVAEQTGVAELEKISIEEKVEREALARLKDLQEQAYQQAYQLGLDEGRQKAFEHRGAEIEEKLAHFKKILEWLSHLKKDLVTFNETHIMRLVFYLAKRLALSEISIKPEIVLTVAKQAIESAQTEESIAVRVSPGDFEFIEGAREKLGKEFEVLKKVRFEINEQMSNGGCVVETNYGDVDATIEQRLEKLWAALSEKLPRTRDVVGSATGGTDGDNRDDRDSRDDRGGSE